MLGILGILDIISALILLALIGGSDGIPVEFLIFISAYLAIKGIAFMISSFDFSSLFDVLAGVTILISIFIAPPIIILIALAIYEGSKGIFTLIA